MNEVLAVVVVLGLSLGVFGFSASAHGAPTAATSSSIALSVNWSAPPVNLSAGFWGADVRPYVAIGPTQAGWWTSTPLTSVVWPGGAVADGFNYTSSVITNTGGSTYAAPQTTAQFVAWCREVACDAILQLPGEVNDPALGAYYVEFVEHTLGFHPAYWEIGNEPARWQEFGLPWAQWAATSGLSVSPSSYAGVVHAYIAAVRAVDPTARFVGLPGTGIGASQETTWLSDTVAVNGPNLSAVAIHVYPAGSGSGTPTLAGFFGSLAGKGSLAYRVPLDRAAVRAACPSCEPIPIFVTESNSGISGGIWDTYMATYPDVPYMAAQLIQAIEVGVANVDVFSFEGAYPGSLFTGTGTSQPIDTLYSTFLSRLGPDAVPTVLGTREQGAFAQVSLSTNGSVASLLLANANASTTLSVSLAGSGFPTVGSAEFWAWNNSASSPVGWIAASGVPMTLSVPPASVLLITAPVGPASSGPAQYPVRFVESGLPSGTGWNVAVDGTLISSTQAAVATQLPNGTYSFAVGGPSTATPTPSSGSFVVSGRGVTEAVQFVLQSVPPTDYPITFEVTGSPSPATWSVTLGNLTQKGIGNLSFAEPNGTYGFSVAPLPNATASPSSGSVVVQGHAVTVGISIHAAGGGASDFAVRFVPSGLTSGAPWQVTLGSVTLSGSGSLDFYVANGSYGFRVVPPRGFSASPAMGTADVAAASLTIDVTFTPPPPPSGSSPTYPVVFVAQGLPAEAVWSVSINGGPVNLSRAGQAVTFQLSNGSYPYFLSSVPGYVPVVPSGTVVVLGAGWVLNVTYANAPPLPGPPNPSSPISLGAVFAPVVSSALLLALLAVVAAGAVYGVDRGIATARAHRRK